MHPSAFEDARRFVERHLSQEQSLTIADLGSYDVNGTLRPLFVRPRWSYCGLDVVAGPNVDRVLSSADSWPELPDAAFDVVVSTQTLEHLPSPWRWMPEAARICKPGGLIYVCSPNTWPYHEHPVDCWRVWPDGLKALFDHAGIDVIEAVANGPDTSAVGRRRRPSSALSAARSAKLTVLCATVGRPTLRRMLESLQRQSWVAGDEVLLVSDGPASEAVAADWGAAALPGRLIALAEGPHRDWGHTPRNRGLRQIDEGYVVHLDDDDVLAPGALPAIRGAIAERPGAAFLFRAALPDGKRIGERPLLKEGNVGTALFVHPASIPLGAFAPRYGGDFDFIAETLALNAGLPLVWRPETTHLLKPDLAPINPAFVDVAQQEGPQGREDCQSGWQEFFGRRFRDVSILDVGAGLGQSRKRLQAGGNRVTLQDPGPGLPVDHHGSLTQFADCSFDVVTAFDVLEHVSDGPAFLAELSRIARTAIVVTTPNVWVSRCGNRFHAREYSPPALLDILAMTPGIRSVDAFASQHASGRRPCQFPASKFLAVEWPVLAAVGWKTKTR